MSLYLNKMLNTLEKDKKKGREALSSNANLRQGADTYKQGMMDVLQRDAPKIQTRNDTLDLNPYTTPALNMRFQQTYSTLDNARKKYGANVDPYEDALRLTDRYGDTVRKSYDLFGGNKAKDYISIADKDQQKQLQETLWGYKYQNSTPEQLRGRLEELQYQSPSQVTARNQQNVIDLAKEKGAKSQAGDMSGLIQAAGNMQGLIGKARQTGWGSLTGDEQEAMRQVLGKVSVGGVGYDTLAWDEMNDRQLNNALSAFSGTRGAAVDKVGKQWAAELTKQQNGLTFEDADKYLQQDAGYSFAAGHQGDLTPYIQAASDMPNVIAKAAKSGWGSLTEPEKESARQVLSRVNVGGMGYDSLAWDDMSDSQVTKALGSLTGARGAAVEKLGKQWAEELKRNNGIYSKYDETAEQAFVLGQYRNTLEGARRYAEDAKGTEEEGKAKDNLYFVEHRTKDQELRKSADFAELSQVNPEYLASEVYARVNGLPQTNRDTGIYLMPYGGYPATLGTQNEYFTDGMTDEEKATFNAYANRDGLKSALDYLKSIEYDLTKRENERQSKIMYDLGASGPGGAALASVLSVPASLLRGAGYLDVLGQRVVNDISGALGGSYRPVNQNSLWQLPGNMADSARQGVMDTNDWTVNVLGRDTDLFDFMYGTGMSMADSVAAGATGFGGQILGLGAAQNAVKDTYDRGGNDRQAMLMGTTAGIFETLFENWSIGKFYDEMKHLGKRGFKDAVINMLAQAGINFSEEFNTELFDMMADEQIMGSKSQTEKDKKEYMRLGMSEDEANARIAEDKAWRLAEAGFGGALMGAGFGGISNVASNISTAKTDKKTGAALKPGTRANLATLAGQFNATKALADKYDPAKATNRQTGELLRETLNQLTGQDRRRLIDALAVDFQETGIEEKNSRAIVQMMAGEELAPEQIQSLARDERALDALYEALGVKEKEEKPAGSGPKFGNMKLGENNRLEAMDTEEGLKIAPMPGTRSAEESRPERPALHPESEAVSLYGEAVATPQTERREAPERPALNTESQMQALDGEAVPARQSSQAEQEKQKKPTIVRPMAFEAGAQDGEAAGGQEKKTVRVSGISRDKSSGAVEVTLEDGQRVALEDAGISREAQDLAAEAADLPQDAQNAMVASHRKGQDVKAYARGFKAIYNMAAIGQDGKTVRSLYGDELTQEQRDAAIEAGKAEYERTRVQRAARTLQAAQELKRRGFAFRTLDEGQTDRGGVYLAQVEKPMSDGAAAQLRVINDLAEDYGVQVRVYDHLDANGFYQGGTNIINVALDAEEEMLGRTTSHELFHFVKEWNREAGQRIQDFVLNTLRETKGYNLDERIEQVRTKGGQNLDPEAAKEDIAAESILDVLANEKNISALYKEVNSEAVKAKNPGLWQQITNWIKDTVAKLRAGMERIAWNHPEVRAMKDQTDKIAQIAEWMDQAARQAGENYRAAQEKLFPPVTNDVDVKEYLKAMGQAVTLEDAAEEADGLASRLFMRAEQDWIGTHQDEYEQGFDAFRQALDEYTQGKKTLPRAFEDAGLDVPKENLFPVLAYAGRQWSSARKQMEQENKFQMRADVEETKDLIAVHNVEQEGLEAALEMGGLPSPSVAVIRKGQEHSKYGDISFVFRKDTIDPESSEKNKLYGTDAWTPTRQEAQVETELNDETLYAARNKAKELLNGDDPYFTNEAERWYNVRVGEDSTRDTLDDWESNAWYNVGMLAQYLRDHGQDVKVKYREEIDTDGYKLERAEMYDAFLDELLRQDRLSDFTEDIQGKSLDQLISTYGPVLGASSADGARVWNVYQEKGGKTPKIAIINRIQQAYKYMLDNRGRNAALKSVKDWTDTRNAMQDQIDRESFRQWIKDTLSGAFGKKGIRNKTDAFTRSGERRSFKQLHWDYTLENIVRAMNEASPKGGHAGGATGLMAKSAKEYATIDAMREDKGRLQSLDQSDYDRQVEALEERMENFVRRVSSRKGLYDGIVRAALTEAGEAYAKNGTEGAVSVAFRKEGSALTESEIQEAAALIRAAQEIPTGYFEAKPQRAVPFSEAALAVVPESMSEAMRQRLLDAGVGEVVTYPDGDQEARKEAMNGRPDLMFSQRADSDERQDDKTLRSLQADPEFYTQAMSDEETADAVRMFARIYRELEHVKGDLVGNVTGREDWKLRRTEIAQRLIAETGSKMKLNDVANWVGRLFNALDQGGYDVGEALIYARQLGMALVREAPGMEIPMDDATKEARRIIKSRAFYLTDDQKSEAAASYGTLGAYMRKNYGRMKIRKKGPSTPSLAEVWVEDLTPLNPGVFSPDATEADMVTILDAWLDNSGERKYSADFGANAGHYATSIGLELMGEYLDMPWTNTRVNRLSDTYNKSLKKLRDNYQGKYEKQVEKARERREAREEKNGILNDIKRMVRPVRTRVMNATDSRHIPEDLRGAAEAFLHIFDRDKAIFTGHEIQELANKYKLMAENGALHDSAAAARYDQDIDSMLQWLSQKMGEGRSLRKMSTDELKMISNIAQHITSLFTDTNQSEVNGRQVNLEREAESFMADMRSREEAKIGRVQTAARALEYKEMTPVYFGKRVGGIVQQCINDLILNGQPKYAKHAQEAREFFEETAKKYHINNWINSKDHLKIETFQGDQLELTKEQAMTLYAWWKREQTNTMQNGAHLRLGGFTYDLKDKDVRKLEGVDLHKSHVLSSVDMNEIEKYLGSEAVGFVTDMVDYLSKTVSEWGNEASMALFGWKKYGEKWYFPYPTDSQFRGKDLAFGSKGQNRKLKNISASHALLENAHNPLKLGNFTRIWAEHVDEMAMYNAFAQKLDNLERVTNYVVDGETQEEGEEEGGKLKITSPESAKKLMEKAMGTEAVQYLEQFINDVNGGVRGDERGFSARMLSLFKKGSVAANLSVMLQQPSAFVRAMSMVSPRYFVKGLNPKDLKGVKARMYENSGTAIIKDMGRFDTNVGQSSVEWILDAVNNPSRLGAAYDFMDEWTGKGAELADELTWCWMYSAVENEVEATSDLKPGTKEFNEAAGKRFDAVMTQTQVYDSTLAKSPWMRSTGGMDKMVTSFMSEPTLWFNMLMDAAADVTEKKQGAGKKAAAAAGVFIGGTLVNALLKSLATAMRRKDDEGRTWLEKYLAEVTGNFVEDISPFGILNMVPLARDMVSIVQGYDVERADMTQVSDLWKKVEKLMKKGGDASATEWIDAGAAAANIFGIPARNVIRDMKGLWGAFFGGANANEPNTGRDIWLSILDNVGDTIKIGPYSVWDSSRSAYYNRMEQALLAGDMDKYNKLRGYMEETNQVKSDAVTQGIKAELKASVQGGLISDDRALEVLTGSLEMEQDKAWALVDKWVQEKDHEGEEEYSYQKYSTLWGLMDAGKDLAAEKKRLAGGGVKESTIENEVKKHIAEQYKTGAITEKQAESLIKKYMGVTDPEEIHWLIDEWAYKRDNGSEASYSEYVDVYDAVKNGKSLAAPMKEMTNNGYEEKDVRSKIRSQIGKWYKAGELTKAQTESKLKQYAGITDANDLYWAMDQLDYEKANAKNKSAAKYAKYASYYKAIETGNNLTQETNRYLSHGVAKDTMSKQITEYYKPKYTALVKAGRTAEADQMMQRLLRAYEVLGYERSKKRKDIEKWLK